MPSAEAAVSELSSIAAEEERQFLAEVADGLHALAQPLTILRSAIEMIGVCQRSGASSQRYFDLSAEHIQRACEQFAAIQGLIRTKLVPARSETVDFGALISRVVEERNIALQGRGIGIAAAIPTSLNQVEGEAARMEEAVSAALDAAVLVSSHGDVVQLQVSETDGFIEIGVQFERREKTPLPAAVRLMLALAKADILSQQGRYYFVDDPFSVSLALPLSPFQTQRERAAHQ
jgi:hypothetical protein